MKNMDEFESTLPGYFGYNPEFAARALRDSREKAKRKKEAAALAEAEKRQKAEEALAEMKRKKVEANRERAKEDMAALSARLAEKPKLPLVSRIIMNVAHGAGLTVEDILGQSRVRGIVEVRQLAMHTVKQLRPDLSINRIGVLFNRDHTTVLHAIAKIETRNAKGKA